MKPLHEIKDEYAAEIVAVMPVHQTGDHCGSWQQIAFIVHGCFEYLKMIEREWPEIDIGFDSVNGWEEMGDLEFLLGMVRIANEQRLLGEDPSAHETEEELMRDARGY